MEINYVYFFTESIKIFHISESATFVLAPNINHPNAKSTLSRYPIWIIMLYHLLGYLQSHHQLRLSTYYLTYYCLLLTFNVHYLWPNTDVGCGTRGNITASRHGIVYNIKSWLNFILFISTNATLAVIKVAKPCRLMFSIFIYSFRISALTNNLTKSLQSNKNAQMVQASSRA